MKFLNINFVLFVIFALACHLSFTLADEGGPVPKRIALRRPAGKSVGKPTTSTTQAPADEEEGDYNEHGEENQYGDEGEGEDSAASTSTTTTTTETPKRVGPVIRPFRSNDDFLTSLKRRQMNAKKNKSDKPAPKPSKPAPSQDSQEEGEESAPVAAPAPSKAFNKPNSALNRRKLSKPTKPEPVEDTAAEESEPEQKEEEAKPKRTLGRLALRKRN